MQEPPDEAARAASFAAWTGWFESMGSSVVEKGNPVSEQTTVGQAANTRVGGYSLIEAPDAAGAAAVREGMPDRAARRRRGDRRDHGRVRAPAQRSRGGAGGLGGLSCLSARCTRAGRHRRPAAHSRTRTPAPAVPMTAGAAGAPDPVEPSRLTPPGRR